MARMNFTNNDYTVAIRDVYQESIQIINKKAERIEKLIKLNKWKGGIKKK